MAKNSKSSKTSLKVLGLCFAALAAGIVIGAGGTFGVTEATYNEQKNTENSEHHHEVNTASEGIVYDDLRINFLELGNKYAGDCTYIKAGDVDILIDAGSRADSADDIKNYVDQYCTDNKLEYVIATHGHQDHIAAFVGNKSMPGLLESYDIGTLVYFSQTAGDTKSTLVKNFDKCVDKLKEKGTTCLPANEAVASTEDMKSYKLADDMYLDILWNKYYYEKSTDENDHSVIAMIRYKDHSFFFTGDLEKGGEEAFAEHFAGKGVIPSHVDLFKGGHHGSKTSSNDVLLDLIDPQMCCVCCCAGSTEYTKNRVNVFPTQLFIDRIAKHTDAVYITSMWDEEKKAFVSMNGNITVSCNGTQVAVAASNNLTKLKDTAWFTHTVYVNSSDQIVEKGTAGATERQCRDMPTQWQSAA